MVQTCPRCRLVNTHASRCDCGHAFHPLPPGEQPLGSIAGGAEVASAVGFNLLPGCALGALGVVVGAGTGMAMGLESYKKMAEEAALANPRDAVHGFHAIPLMMEGLGTGAGLGLVFGVVAGLLIAIVRRLRGR